MDWFSDALSSISTGNGGSGRGGGRSRGRGRGRGRGGAGRGGFSHTRGNGRGAYGYQSGPPRSADPRQHLSASEMPAPSSAHLDVSTKESNTVTPDQAAALEPLILVFSLNHTLVSRSAASAQASRDPVKRPYLSTFLSYLVSASEDSDVGIKSARRKLKTVVFTGTRAHNVLLILKSIDLATRARTARLGEPYQVDAVEGDLLDLDLSGEDMDLGADYHNKVHTLKDLGRVWFKFGIKEERGAERTELVNDDAFKCGTSAPDVSLPNLADSEWRVLFSPLNRTRCCPSRLSSQTRNPAAGTTTSSSP
jgi:hypothetical protein